MRWSNARCTFSQSLVEFGRRFVSVVWVIVPFLLRAAPTSQFAGPSQNSPVFGAPASSSRLRANTESVFTHGCEPCKDPFRLTVRRWTTDRRSFHSGAVELWRWLQAAAVPTLHSNHPSAPIQSYWKHCSLVIKSKWKHDVLSFLIYVRKSIEVKNWLPFN